eukprot:COSAG01_NODE_13160_length_1626_cov_5.939096_1_plen_81_part_00
MTTAPMMTIRTTTTIITGIQYLKREGQGGARIHPKGCQVRTDVKADGSKITKDPGESQFFICHTKSVVCDIVSMKGKPAL